MRREKEIPEPFRPHPSLGEDINARIMESQMEGGARLDKLEVNHAFEMRTAHNRYVIEKRGDGYYISGHAGFCRKPTKVVIHGSTWGHAGLMPNFVGRGMHLEFKLPDQDPFQVILTSPIEDVRELSDTEYEEFKKGEEEKKKKHQVS